MHVVADLDHDDGQRHGQPRDARHERAGADEGERAGVDPAPGVAGRVGADPGWRGGGGAGRRVTAAARPKPTAPQLGMSDSPPSCPLLMPCPAHSCSPPPSLGPLTGHLLARYLGRRQPDDAPQAGSHHDHGHKQPRADGAAGRERRAEGVPPKHDEERAVVEAVVRAAREEVLDAVVACRGVGGGGAEGVVARPPVRTGGGGRGAMAATRQSARSVPPPSPSPPSSKRPSHPTPTPYAPGS